MSKKNQHSSRSSVAASALSSPVRTAAASFAAAAAFFLTVCLNSVSTGKAAAAVCIILALIAVIARSPVLRERSHLPLAVLALFVLFGGISLCYASAAKFALREFLKLAVSLCVVIIMLCSVRGQGTRPGRAIASIIERSVALSGLVSIDLISTRLLSGAVFSVLGLFTAEYQDVTGLEAGIRITSMFGNPNIFAGSAGIGVLLALGLALSSETKKERAGHTVCLFISALAFVLAFSMGASAFIVIAFLVYLALEHKKRRAGLFLLMAETLIFTVAAAALISATSLTVWDGIRPVPLLCTAAGSAVLCLSDRFVGSRVADRLSGHGKALAALIAAALVLAAAFALLAYSLTGGVSLSSGETLRRSAYPAPGEYTLTAESDGPVTVTVESQNRQAAMMHTSTVIYSGELAQAAFTVPEDSLVVYFNFQAGQDLRLESVVYEGAADSGPVPLGYKLLPGFIANRLQGLFANQNAIQRLVFFDDGLKLFRRSPVTGLGLGAFESAIMSVQSFHYETKYAHNHYIQSLAETGIIGFVLFVALLGVSAAAVLLARRRQDDFHPLLPSLGAALVFMAGHAGVEVVFSASSYLPVAFGAFALINLCCGEAIALPGPGGKNLPKIKNFAIVGCSVLMAVFLLLLGGNMLAQKQVSASPSLDNLQKAINLDKFENADYMLSYVVSTQGVEVPAEIRAQADAYAERLAGLDSNTVPLYLSEYYFMTAREAQAVDMLKKYVSYVSSDPEVWQTAVGLMMFYVSASDVFIDGLLDIYQMMLDWNEANMGNITLSADALEFINAMKELGA